VCPVEHKCKIPFKNRSYLIPKFSIGDHETVHGWPLASSITVYEGWYQPVLAQHPGSQLSPKGRCARKPHENYISPVAAETVSIPSCTEAHGTKYIRTGGHTRDRFVNPRTPFVLFVVGQTGRSNTREPSKRIPTVRFNDCFRSKKRGLYVFLFLFFSSSTGDIIFTSYQTWGPFCR
jgi:hypothetical protein